MTTIETGPAWSERLDPRNWPLAWKLVVVGLIPAVLALVLGILQVATEAERAADLGRSTRLLEAERKVADTADAVRQERHTVALFAAGNRSGDRGAVETGFGQTDGEVDAMLGAVRTASELEVTTRSALQKAEREITTLGELRQDALTNPAVSADELTTRYTAVVDSIDILGTALLRQLSVPGIGGLPDALTAVKNVTEQLAVQHTVLGSAIERNSVRPIDVTAVNSTDSQIDGAIREYQSALTLGVVGNPVDATANTRRELLKAAMLTTPPNGRVTVAQEAWDAAYNDARAATVRSGDRIRNGLTTASTAAEEQASNEAGLNSVILMLGLLLGVAIAVLVARSLLRSLRVLRRSALEVAERRLPQAVESMRAGKTPDVAVEPVPLAGRDEVGQVARAFDAVHGQAVHLAAEQAALQANVSAMFVNLSRRSQALVERQLQLIEQLESNEQDPDQLSNLFQLDHLATRMRRNSENLLVLAGTDLAKRNIAPVPLVDVLRAAVSEVDQYQRIVVQVPPTATILGRAASDIVHLLAELLDNATNFSPPDSQVIMSTTGTADGSIMVEISDRGVGMSDHELSDANERLRGPSTVNVSASRRMGLFVVGRLASRHTIDVRLSSSQGGPAAGLTAIVMVPAHLVPSLEPEVQRTYAGQPSLSAPGQPAQRGVNGSGGHHPGSLSALVAGTDGPANPISAFDVPGSTDRQIFNPPPQLNGSSNGMPGLPTRRPGSTLRPDGPPLPPSTDEPTQAGGPDPDADRAAAERAREVAEQARRDQEAAAARAAAKAAEQHQPGRNGITPNGIAPQQAPGRTPEPEPEEQQVAEPLWPADEQASTSSRVQARPEDDRDAAPEQPAASDPSAPTSGFPVDSAIAPPTMPFHAVRPAAPPEQQGQQGQTQGQQAQQQTPPLPPPRLGQPIMQPLQSQRPPAPAQPPAAMPPADPNPPSTDDQGTGLFAPQMPVIAEPGRQADPAGPRSAGSFDLGETTPIFEEIASAWFRSNRPIPVAWQAGDEAPDGSGPAPQAGPQQGPPAPERAPLPGLRPAQPPAPQAAPNPRPVQQPTPPPRPMTAPAPTPAPRPAPRPVPRPEPVAEAAPQPQSPTPPTAQPQPQPMSQPSSSPIAPAPDQEFASAADEGWRAVSGMLADASEETTSAGLPKRRPRARLVPGSAGSAVLASPVGSARDAETIRSRLASYQSGVRQGREYRSRSEQGALPDDFWGSGNESAGSAGRNHDEESS